VLSRTHPEDRDEHRNQSMRSRQEQESESWDHRIVRPDGEVRWVRRKSAIVGHDDDGAPATMLVTHQDVTSIKRAESEREALQAQLTQAQKMEAVGNLTGGIAHDFNNILAVAIGNLDLLKMELEPGSESDGLVETALSACLKGSELTKSLLAFSRRQPLQPKRVEINKLLGDNVKMLSRAIGERVQVELKLADSLWDVQIDPSQLESALLNMMVNARDAMPDGGRIIVQTRNTYLDQAYCDQNDEVHPGDYVALELSDTGHGMPPEVVARVFEPFFTTKEKGKGTGLGLAMVFGFVKQSGGHVKIYSEVGHGTTIRLYLPRAGINGVHAAERVESTGPATARNEMILVVEDNPAVRRTVVKQLTNAGYRVADAENGAHALEMIEGGIAPVDLVFSDVVMPGRFTGPELAREIGRRWPNIKVLLTSGFPEGLISSGSMIPDDIKLLSKPYRTEELLRKLREVLDVRQNV
jgi:signal transduction histidine kinase